MTTGRASPTASHGSRPGKAIVSTSNGIVAVTATASRGARGAGSRTTPAVYPVASTTRTRSASATDGGYDTRAVSVAKLTLALTPSSRLSRFSTRIAHEAQVIPPIARSTVDTQGTTTVNPAVCTTLSTRTLRNIR